MIKQPRLALAIALLCTLAAVPLLIVPAVAQQPDRAKQIGGKFLCMCGCTQVLTQCNHVGCTVSTVMLKQIDQTLAQGGSEDTITQAFLQQYGTTVYAEPPKSGFSAIAWAMPSAYLLVGTILVVLVIAKWRKPSEAVRGAVPSGRQASAEALERARAQVARETED
jgi:cytochrome c-type biogenesis protein CcmH